MKPRLRNPAARVAAAAFAVSAVALVLAVAGCSTPHAVPVECGKNLRPINVRPAGAVAPSFSEAHAGAERGS